MSKPSPSPADAASRGPAPGAAARSEARRTALARAVFFGLAIANCGIVFGGAVWLTAMRVERLETGFVQKVTADAQARSADLAKRVMSTPAAPAKDEVAALVERARRVGADVDVIAYEMAVVPLKPAAGVAPRVVAANAAALVGQAPEAGVARALAGKLPDGEIQLPSEQDPRSTYTAYYVGEVGGGRIPIMSHPASAAPAPRRALRTIKRMVKKKLPGGGAKSYTIKDGDTLYNIARTQLGEESRFQEIWQANRSVLGAVNGTLPVGKSITLPGGAAREVMVAQDLTIYAPSPPAPKPTVVGMRVIAAQRVALKLVVAVRTREAVLASDRKRTLVAAALAALLTGLAWWAGFMLMERRRRRALDAQRAALSRLVAERLDPRPAALDRSLLRSPFQVEHAAAVLPGREPGGAVTDLRVLGDSLVGLFIADATGWNATASIARGLANAVWRVQVAVPAPSTYAGLASAAQPRQALLEINRHLVDYIAQGDHVTALYAVVDVMSGAVTFASAAHTGAFILDRRGALTMLGSKGLPLGIGQELFAGRLEEGQLRLAEGESLLLFTDGVTKAENAAGEPFGMERLEKCLRERPGCEPEAVIATIRRALEAFTGTVALGDESAIVCLRLAAPLGGIPRLSAMDQTLGTREPHPASP